MTSIHLNVNLSLQQLIEVVKQLSFNEKIKLSEEAIWNEKMGIPEEHQALVLNRIKKAEKHPEKLLDWDKVSKTLRP